MFIGQTGEGEAKRREQEMEGSRVLGGQGSSRKGCFRGRKRPVLSRRMSVKSDC